MSGTRRITRRRRALAGALAAALLAVALTGAAPAGAHPLGNFSINHLTFVRVARDDVDVRYVLDQAEIPTFQERGLSRGAVLARKRAEVARRLRVIADGQALTLREVAPAAFSHPPGQAGLPLTRVVLTMRAALARPPRSVVVRDETFPDRVGWKGVVVQPGAGTAVRSNVPDRDPTGGLRHYPRALLTTPLDERVATLSVRRGSGSVTAPVAPGGPIATESQQAGDGLSQVFADAAAGRTALVLLLLAAFGWGAAHALSPGHGKSMVAAYLVGTRGRARHAVALGTIVTATHTAGVFALGLVTLSLSQFILPEQLYPWLSLASGLLVVGVGTGVLRSRLRRARRVQAHAHGHGHDHAHGHGHDHAHVPEELSWRGILGMGAAAGLLPCPSALVVLLAALSQHRVGLGLVLIVAFSLGLAATLTSLGLIVVHAQRLTRRLPRGGGRVVAALPVLSTVAILALGVMLTARAVPGVV